jgi:hypothetical protein
MEALRVWRLGAVAICPHKNTAYYDGALTDDTIIAGDLELVRHSDAVYAIQGWKGSEGARLEVQLAKDLGIPVLEKIEEIEAWIRS